MRTAGKLGAAALTSVVLLTAITATAARAGTACPDWIQNPKILHYAPEPGPPPSVEQIGPDRSTASLSETQDWLRRRGPEFEALGEGPTKHSTWSFPSNCLLRIDYPSFVVGRDIISASTQETNLKLVDPISFTVVSPSQNTPTHWALHFGGNGKYHFATNIPAGHLCPTPGSPGVLTPNHESAFRLGRALKHAAILCGAKVDAF